MTKIKLYTCDSGLNLFKKGFTFSAWEKGEFEDVAFFVDDNDTVINEYGDYDLLNIKSVEIA